MIHLPCCTCCFAEKLGYVGVVIRTNSDRREADVVAYILGVGEDMLCKY